MTSHNFDQSLLREKEFFSKADLFYSAKLSATNINRFDYKTDEGKKMQLLDVDLSFNIDNITKLVSEKKRGRNYGDLYLETFSKYPHTKGWMTHTKANLLAYFFIDSALIVNMDQLKEFFENKLNPLLKEEWYKEINSFKNSSRRIPKIISLELNNYEINIIQAYNNTRGIEWHTLGISVPLKVLKDNNISYSIYSL